MPRLFIVFTVRTYFVGLVTIRLIDIFMSISKIGMKSVSFYVYFYAISFACIFTEYVFFMLKGTDKVHILMIIKGQIVYFSIKTFVMIRGPYVRLASVPNMLFS